MSDPELELRVAKLERLVANLYRVFNEAEPTSTGNGMELDKGIREALRKNNMIEAIKIYRAKTDTSLAEAKRAVEEIVDRYGPFR